MRPGPHKSKQPGRGGKEKGDGRHGESWRKRQGTGQSGDQDAAFRRRGEHRGPGFHVIGRKRRAAERLAGLGLGSHHVLGEALRRDQPQRQSDPLPLRIRPRSLPLARQPLRLHAERIGRRRQHPGGGLRRPQRTSPRHPLPRPRGGRKRRRHERRPRQRLRHLLRSAQRPPRQPLLRAIHPDREERPGRRRLSRLHQSELQGRRDQLPLDLRHPRRAERRHAAHLPGLARRRSVVDQRPPGPRQLRRRIPGARLAGGLLGRLRLRLQLRQPPHRGPAGRAQRRRPGPDDPLRAQRRLRLRGRHRRRRGGLLRSERQAAPRRRQRTDRRGPRRSPQRLCLGPRKRPGEPGQRARQARIKRRGPAAPGRLRRPLRLGHGHRRRQPRPGRRPAPVLPARHPHGDPRRGRLLHRSGQRAAVSARESDDAPKRRERRRGMHRRRDGLHGARLGLQTHDRRRRRRSRLSRPPARRLPGRLRRRQGRLLHLPGDAHKRRQHRPRTAARLDRALRGRLRRTH